MKVHCYIFRSVLMFLFLCCLSTFSAEQPDPYIRSRNLWNEYNNTTIDSVKIRLLSNLAYISTNFLDNAKLADSISDIAIRIAERSKSPFLEVTALNNYFESMIDFEWNTAKAMKYARKALALCHNPGMAELELRTLHNLVAIYSSRSLYDSAAIESRKLMELAEKLNNKRFIVQSYIDIGMSLEGQLKMIDALNNYLNAEKLAQEINNKELLKKCYAILSDFYNLIKTFDKALEYKRKQQVILLTETHPVDSVELMWTENQKHGIILRYNNLLDEKSVEKVIDYSKRTNNIRLKTYEFAIYRKHLIDMEKMDELYRLYNEKYSEEMRLLFVNDIGTYYRFKAFFKDYERQYDSAYYYFTLAEQKIGTHPNLLFRSTFYVRFGQFLKRIGKNKEAIENFTKAYQLAEEYPLFGRMDFMLTPAVQLNLLYVLLGDFRNAYFYSEKSHWLRNNISIVSNKEKVDRMWLDYQIKLDNEKRDIQLRQGRNERNMMAGGVIFLFIVSLLIFRNYRNQKRSNTLLDAAKKKSEVLLLNILPYETAEELKMYGTAKAKRFDEVTVMFTDFKDFTHVSEKLSAEELVEKINFYFSEFDRIISRHNIEKIKIIGDSYMCAGGLPVSNDTHASDVVSAALEFQAFMKVQKEERIRRNESYFELRIGIHTGPVVAGIVGLKKFAYDIWGDTVNTASRMESTCETDKVNISGSTYERIKDRFEFTYRGKVKAKHKGEIDMYFVIPPDQPL